MQRGIEVLQEAIDDEVSACRSPSAHLDCIVHVTWSEALAAPHARRADSASGVLSLEAGSSWRCFGPPASSRGILPGAACERCAGMQEAEEGDAEALQEQLCSALCCLAEAQMGLAGEAEEVAGECEALLLRAAQAAQGSPEPMQVALPLHSSSTPSATKQTWA